jgi:hypothetical protein
MIGAPADYRLAKLLRRRRQLPRIKIFLCLPSLSASFIASMTACSCGSNIEIEGGAMPRQKTPRKTNQHAKLLTRIMHEGWRV